MALFSPTTNRSRLKELQTIGVLAAVSGLSIEEAGEGPVRQTRFIFTAMPMTITDALAYASQLIYTMPKGRINFLGATGTLVMTTTSAIASTLNSGVAVSLGIGTAAASNIVLATTMQNVIPGTGIAVTNATSSTVINVAPAALNFAFTATINNSIDGTTTAVPLYLNVGVPTNTDIDADATVTFTGEVVVLWANLGNYGVATT